MCRPARASKPDGCRFCAARWMDEDSPQGGSFGPIREPTICGGCDGTGRQSGLRAGLPAPVCDLCKGTGVLEPNAPEPDAS